MLTIERIMRAKSQIFGKELPLPFYHEHRLISHEESIAKNGDKDITGDPLQENDLCIKLECSVCGFSGYIKKEVFDTAYRLPKYRN